MLRVTGALRRRSLRGLLLFLFLLLVLGGSVVGTIRVGSAQIPVAEVLGILKDQLFLGGRELASGRWEDRKSVV